ncbi:septum formation family protein [Spirillospora sp. NPDC047418]
MTDAPSWAPPDPSPAAPASPEPAPSGAPADAPPPASAPVPRRTNRLAIAAAVTGAVGLVPIALGLGIAALVRLRGGNEKGRGYAVSGLAGAGIWTIAAVVIAAMAVNSMVGVNRDESGRVRKSGMLLVSALRPGDCFAGPLPGNRHAIVSVTPCTRPHDSEVTGAGPLPEEPYPGDEALNAESARWCATRNFYLGNSPHMPDLRYYRLVPDKAGWKSGNRTVICSVLHTGSDRLTSTLAETIDPNLKYYYELKPRDCLADIAAQSLATTTVPCTDPHRNQVYATYQLPLESGRAPSDYPPYPGTGVVRANASRFCTTRARKLFGGHPPPVPVRRQVAGPTQEYWEIGIRTVVCLARTTKPLKRSLLPK